MRRGRHPGGEEVFKEGPTQEALVQLVQRIWMEEEVLAEIWMEEEVLAEIWMEEEVLAEMVYMRFSQQTVVIFIAKEVQCACMVENVVTHIVKWFTFLCILSESFSKLIHP